MTVRFWTHAEAQPHGASWQVMLDGKMLRLPSGATLGLSTAPLAAAVAAEWQQAGGAKGGKFGPKAVPLTGLAGSVQERVAPAPGATAAALAAYAAADVLCYRVEQPAALARAQHATWQPWLDWAAARYAAPLDVTTTLRQLDQPARSLARLRAALDALRVDQLAALGLAIPALGSCVLGLALAEGRLDAAAAAAVALHDELYQQRHWGADEEAADRRGRIERDIALAERFMELSHPKVADSTG